MAVEELTMRLLLDTHIFIWLTGDSPRLIPRARQVVESASAIYVSSVSIWEVAIKSSLGKIKADPEDLLEEIVKCGFVELPVVGRHASQVARLPLLHTDPFDRLLIAQAMTETLHLLTADTQLAAYSELVIPI